MLANATFPCETGAKPQIARKMGDLPEPDSPTMPKLSPAATVNDVPATATKSPYSTRSWLTSKLIDLITTNLFACQVWLRGGWIDPVVAGKPSSRVYTDAWRI